jgi:hypothetical protein
MSVPKSENKEFVLEGDDGTVDDAALHAAILPELSDLAKTDKVVGEDHDDDDLSDLDDLVDL